MWRSPRISDRPLPTGVGASEGTPRRERLTSHFPSVRDNRLASALQLATLMNRRLFLKTSFGLASLVAASRYSFGNNLRRISKFSVTLPGLGRDGANNMGNYLPVLSPDTRTFHGTDYYDIVAGQFTQTLHP